MIRRSSRVAQAALIVALTSASSTVAGGVADAADPTPVSVTVESATPVAFRNQVIDFTVRTDPIPDGGNVLVKSGSRSSTWVPVDPSGVTTVPLRFGLVGTYQIEAVYGGNAGFAYSVSPSIQQQVITLATTTTLTVTPPAVHIHEAFTLKVAVEPKPERDVTVQISGAFVPNVLVDAETGLGEVIVDYPERYNYIGYGDHELVAHYPGTDYTEASNSNPATLSIVRDPTTTMLELAPSSIEGATVVRATATVTPPPPLDTVVRFVIHGAPEGYSTWSRVNAEGVATADLDVGVWPTGSYTVEATVDETDDLESSSGSATLLVGDTEPPAGSVRIEDGAEYTTSRAVRVDVPATDGARSIEIVSLSNDGAVWTDLPYVDQGDDVGWMLSEDDGEKVVRARWMDENGNWSEVASDSITLDLTAPLGEIRVGDSEVSATRAVVVVSSAVDAVSGVAHVALSNDGVTWTTFTDAPTVNWTLSIGSGMKTVFAKWRDAAGNWSDPVSDTILFDASGPAATAPTRTFVTGQTITRGKVPVRLGWSGHDAMSGIVRYELAQKTDGGTWVTVVHSLTQPSIDRALAPGHSYRFRVRAIDRAENAGAWVAGSMFTLSRYSEGSRSIKYAGSWRTVSSSAYWNGKAKSASARDARATFSVTGRTIAWVSTRGPGRGEAVILVNGKKIASVDLSASTYQNQRIVWSKTWSASATRTVTIRILGTSGRPRVDLDAILVAS